LTSAPAVLVYTQLPSLQKHRVGGRTYWRIVESRRVKGRPRPVPILYLGTAEALLERLLAAEAGRLRVRSYEHGAVAALKAAADRLRVASIIDDNVKKSARGLSVGQTMVLAAMNRAVRPRSKRGWAQWAEGTSLHRLYRGLRAEKLTSEYFWDQMDCISLEALEEIEEELTGRVVSTMGVELDTLFYDTTNFFTYIATTNPKSRLTRRGRSKQKRNDLRLFSLALLVSRDGHVPICSHVYEGNRPDSKEFPASLTAIRERLEKLSVGLKDITLVYDKGNNSKRNQALVDETPFGYVASLVPSQHRELLELPVSSYTPVASGRLEGTPVLRLTKDIWGAQRTVVLFVSERLKAGQVRGLEQHMRKLLKELGAWKERLERPRSGPRSVEAAERKIDSLLAAQHLRKIVEVQYHPKRRGAGRLSWRIDTAAREHLEKEVFGKRMLITDRRGWTDEEIILAYRGQSEVEGAFRQAKDDEHLAIRPQYHWTDHKVRVHVFICLVAFLLARVVEREARKAGRRECLSGILDLLGDVRLAMVLTASGKTGGRPRARWQLEETAAGTLDLFRRLVPARPPFVYTPPEASSH
jgi:transposase